MKKSKLLVLVGVVACLLAATLAGCGKKEATVTQRNNSVVTTPDVLTPPETVSEPDDVDEVFNKS